MLNSVCPVIKVVLQYWCWYCTYGINSYTENKLNNLFGLQNKNKKIPGNKYFYVSFRHCIEVLMKLILKIEHLPSWDSGKSHGTVIKSCHTLLWEGQIIPIYPILFLYQFNKCILNIYWGEGERNKPYFF